MLTNSFQYTAVLTALFPLAALWLSGRQKNISLLGVMGWTVSAALIGAVVFFSFNPYHLVNLDIVRKDLAHTSTPYPFRPLDVGLIPVGIYLVAIAGGPGLWASGLCIAFGAFSSKRRMFPAPGFRFTLGVLVGIWLVASFVVSGGFYATNARFSC